MQRIVAFVRLGRPLFLAGGFVLYGLGAAVAVLHGHAIGIGRYLVGQAAVTAFQLMTHYANDYFDYEADIANLTPTRWSGGSRVLANAELPRGVALAAACVLALAGTGLAVGAAVVGGGWTVPILGATLVLAWVYSAPPLRLCARGLGELDTAVVVTGLVPLLGFYLQAADFAGARTLALVLVPVFVLQVAMLLAIEFPDATGDAVAGKRTLVVRFGPAMSARLYVGLTAAAFAWLPIGYALGMPARIAIFGALPLPVAVWRIVRIAEHRDPTRFERLAFFAVFLLVATAVCELVGCATLVW